MLDPLPTDAAPTFSAPSASKRPKLAVVPRIEHRRILLVYPPTPGLTVMPPLGVGYLASVAMRSGFAVEIVDLSRRHMSWRQFDEFLRRGRHALIGLSVSTPNLHTAAFTATRIRAARPDVPFVVGGIHVTCYPEKTVRDFGADYAFLHESEVSFPRFLEDLARGDDPVGRVPGVYANRGGRWTGLAPEPIGEIDPLPWPAWEQLAPDRYPPIPHQLFVKAFPVAPIMTTRGCPMNCSFCATTRVFGKKIRRRRADDVIAEIDFLRRRFGIRELHFEDDNLTLHRGHAVRLFEAIIREQPGLFLKCPNGLMTVTLDQELLHLMKRAGMYQISLGIETTSPDLMPTERKYLPNERVRSVVSMAKKAGLEVQGLFIAGLPGDTDDAFRHTVRDAVSMGLDLAHFGLHVPLPGSRDGDGIREDDLNAINFFTVHPVNHKRWTINWKSLQRWAVLRFYLRPRPLSILLRRTKLRQFPGVMKVFGRYVLGWGTT